jgi:hypothetical protein
MWLPPLPLRRVKPPEIHTFVTRASIIITPLPQRSPPHNKEHLVAIESSVSSDESDDIVETPSEFLSQQISAKMQQKLNKNHMMNLRKLFERMRLMLVAPP